MTMMQPSITIEPTDEVRYDRLVRAVRGVTPGLFDPEIRRFYALTWEAKNIGCPDCWANVSHSVAAWKKFHTQ